MTISLHDVEAAALKLSIEERTELIERLIDTVSPTPPLHPAWAAEIERRVAEMDAGHIESIPAKDVMAELHVMRRMTQADLKMLAVDIRALSADREQTPSEKLLREGRCER